MISCVLLTAGESRRFGSPKALAPIHSIKAIEWVQEKLFQSIVDEIVIVTGADQNLIEPHVFNHSKVRLVHNKDYKFGQTSSFQTGLNIVDKNAEGIMLLPVDCPFIQNKTIDDLILFFTKNQPTILIPTYQKRRGHPPIFHSSLKKDLMDLSVQEGLNSLVEKHHPTLMEMDDPGIVQTFNTPEELKKILELI